jgi:hypothetical protein
VERVVLDALANQMRLCCLIFNVFCDRFHNRSEPDWHLPKKPIHLLTVWLKLVVSFFCSHYAALFDKNAIPMISLLRGPR